MCEVHPCYLTKLDSGEDIPDFAATALLVELPDSGVQLGLDIVLAVGKPSKLYPFK